MVHVSEKKQQVVATSVIDFISFEHLMHNTFPLNEADASALHDLRVAWLENEKKFCSIPSTHKRPSEMSDA